mgnify:CR=1 FL=1
MKFADLLKNWMDARKTYEESCIKYKHDFDRPYLEEQESIVISYENQINDVIERLEAICDNRLL